MAKEEKEAKLKLIHLVYGLLAAALMVGMAIGALMNQQGTNTGNISKNTDKVDTNKEMLIRIDTRQEVMIKGIEEIKEKLK
ncbi:hypothetical protein LCGC14_1205830 [marine sediment metagenome]|uniref:Uncharacterized protein n=1 Tax=marine sediment metagenome TaxID=412755 RepID=A0A0F9PK87_9ZZZZ